MSTEIQLRKVGSAICLVLMAVVAFGGCAWVVDEREGVWYIVLAIVAGTEYSLYNVWLVVSGRTLGQFEVNEKSGRVTVAPSQDHMRTRDDLQETMGTSTRFNVDGSAMVPIRNVEVDVNGYPNGAPQD